MISIDRVFKSVLSLANVDLRGNAKPDEVRMLINLSVNEIIDSYFFDLNKAIWRENVGRINGGLENIPDRIREKILHFQTSRETQSFSQGVFKMPSDLLFIDSIETNANVELEECKNRAEFNAIARVNANLRYPIYYKKGELIETAPRTISTLVYHYLRKHKIAKWTFIVHNGNEIFNSSASDFQDIDLHPSEESNVIIKTLEKLGINLKEQDLTAVSMGKQQQELQKQNS